MVTPTVIDIPLPAPTARVDAGRAIQRWLARRTEPTDTLLLTQRNVYILPTRAGVMFAITLVVLLLASVNYQLNLGYLLTFLLAGSAVVSMHLTHATLRGLTLHLRPVAPVFAGEPAVLSVVLTSPGTARYGVGLRVGRAPASAITWLDVPALGQTQAQVSFVPTARGPTAVPMLTVETRFPLGLFRSWTVWRPAARVTVYPALESPAPALPMQRGSVHGDGAVRTGPSGGGEVGGVRAYRRGDPQQLVAWKKTAKALEAGGELVSRDTLAPRRQRLWLDWQACAGLDPEARLSRLAAWTVAAHRAGIDHGLALPEVEIAPAGGDAQRLRCLEALALWR
jgi:uncharacterized protein (DUF58 family)